ncbi:fibronectin type III domain-containing protein [Flavobacterium sp. CBA20B-1]|uniref:Ig-like domain-containing protein n=1 Tax=Flavobacterium sp. CBA20B-1 TaxID=2918454 RepID=UPI00234A1AC5|nr:fibronectin type III domain-containing protein [Flavobacterium sp. CBA20B-1]WCM41543.1 fibronectin type III domain-containing protein [Flavobacterium sp. CBA20B-1]
MKKITQLSRFKIRWLTTKTLILFILGLLFPSFQMIAQTFSYTGNVQSVTLAAGTYDIEVWGANGGGSQGGIGGYSKVSYTHTGGTLYIVVGGAGATGGLPADINGGYNGGGARPNPGGATRGSGGGATHVSRSSGLLTDAAVRSNIIVVAGGAGGGSNSGTGVGGGGGLTGVNSNGSNPGQGGTQTAGGAAGAGTSGSPGTAGQGGQSLDMAGAGGGGWYGGGAGGGSVAGNTSNGGGGGSGYINGAGVTSGITRDHTQSGFIANPDTSGNGTVIITSTIPCTGTPNGGTATASSRACASQPFTLTLNSYTLGGGISLQWESSPAGLGTWSPIPNATGNTHTVTNQTADTDYRCVVTCTNSNGVSTSNIVTVGQPLAAVNFYESFDAVATGSFSNPTVPECWTYLNKASSGYGYTTTTAARSGKGFYTYRPNTTGEMLLISPQTNNLGNGTKQVRFWARVSSTTYETTQKLGVYTMSDPTSTGVLSLVENNIPLTTTWQEFIVPLPVTTDDYFAFSFDNQNGTAYVYLDDVYYEDLSPCIFPVNLAANNITITGATFTWNPSLAPGVTGYEWEVRTSGTPGTAGAVASGSTTAPSTTATTNALSGATTYYVYVRAVCGANKGVWTTFPVKFTTLCPVYTANFYENFDGVDTGGSTNPTIPNCWTYLNKASSGYGYTTTSAGRTGKGFYTYRPSTSNEMLLISPETNNLGNGTKQVRFWARVSSTSYQSTQKLGLYTMNNPTATGTLTLLENNFPLTTTWQEFIIPLPAGTDDYFAFSFDSQNGTAYVYVDDVYYEDLSPCIFPTNIQVANIAQTSATISWNASLAAGVTGYEYEIRTSGAAGSGATGLVQTGIVNAPATSVNISGLNHSTSYTVYIRSKCGTTDGLWTLFPVKFNTLCGVIMGSFFEGFENADIGGSSNNTVPNCWTYLRTGSNSTYPYGYTGTTGPKTGSKHFYTYQGSSYDGEVTLVSPETDNLGNGTKRLRFSARLYFTGNYGEKLSIYSMNGNTASATKTLIKTVNVSSTAYQEYIVYLPISTTDDYFAFSFDNESMSKYIFIDDIYYEDAPSCRPIEESTIAISNVSKNSFDVSWQDIYNLNQMAYEVEVRTSGNPGTPGAIYSTVTAVGVTNITVPGLAPSTDYTVYVRAVCSATDQSDWAKGPSVTTLCNYSDFVTYTPSLALCGPQKAVLDATLVDTTFEAAWFDSATDVEPLFVGSNFVSEDDVTQNRSFWLRSQQVTPNSSVQIGTGTYTSSGSWEFLYSLYEGYKHQYIYTAKELTDKGLVAGPITALQFDVVSTGNYNPRSNFGIALGTTPNSVSTTNLIPNSNLTQVYINAAQPLNTGIMTFTFTTPYNWDGVSNIVVQVTSDNGASSSPYGQLRGHSTPESRTSVLYGNGHGISGILAANSPSTGGAPYLYGTTSTYRPNTVFLANIGCISPAIEIPVTVSLKPAFELSTASITSCEGGVSDPVTITTNLGNYDTFVWTPSAGVSGDAVNGWTFATNVEQEYVLSATQSNGICEHIKTVRVYAGKKPEALTTLASSYDICKNEIQELEALESIPAMASIGSKLTTTAATSEISAFVQSAMYSKQQYIYTAAELIAQGVNTSGYINSLSFETINSGASLSNPMYTVKMMLTPNATFGTTNFATGNLSTVYSEVNHTHTFQGMQTIQFDSPFYWDGQSNILVEITQEGMGSGNNAQTYFTSVPGSNVGMYATSATDPNPTAGTRTTDRLDVQFGLEQSSVTWSPINNLYVDAAATVPYTAGTNALTVYTTSGVAMNQVYNALLTAPSGCETTKAVTINVADVVTPVVQSQTFCQATPVSNVVVTGGTNATFEFYSSATATTPITNITQTGTYYVEATQGNCKSVRVPFTATVTPLALPTAQFTQVVCGGGTVSALMASGVSGSQIRWYSSATSTTPLASTTPLVDNTTYYASQTLGACESGRIAVLVDINAAPASLTPQTISICGTLNYGNVNLNQIPGAELVWYPSATSTTPIPNNGQIVNGTYYVSQKVNGCESLRVQVIATAQGSVPAPTATIQNICGAGTVAQLNAQILPNATAEWYSNATAVTPLAANTPLTNGTYYVSQRVGNCVSVKVPVAVRLISTAAPAVAPITLCAGSTVGSITLPTPSGVSYRWYVNSTSTVVLPSTDVLQSGYYFVTRVENGCESARTQVQITINSRPNSPTGASPQTFNDTDNAQISSLIMTQPNVVWYATYDDAMKGLNPLNQNMPLVDQTTYYAVIIGSNGCPSLPTPIEVRILLGVNDFDLSKLNYYPNPVNDQLTITYSEVITNVEVFDLNGRLVMKNSFDKETVQLDFSRLSSGTYMLNVKTKENSQFIKIVKK